MAWERAEEAPADRVAVAVITVWTEPGIDGVRARVTMLPTLASEREVSRVTTSVDEALAIARGWLLGAGDDPVTPP
jgi:hypothetical protein